MMAAGLLDDPVQRRGIIFVYEGGLCRAPVPVKPVRYLDGGEGVESLQGMAGHCQRFLMPVAQV